MHCHLRMPQSHIAKRPFHAISEPVHGGRAGHRLWSSRSPERSHSECQSRGTCRSRRTPMGRHTWLTKVICLTSNSLTVVPTDCLACLVSVFLGLKIAAAVGLPACIRGSRRRTAERSTRRRTALQRARSLNSPLTFRTTTSRCADHGSLPGIGVSIPSEPPTPLPEAAEPDRDEPWQGAFRIACQACATASHCSYRHASARERHVHLRVRSTVVPAPTWQSYRSILAPFRARRPHNQGSASDQLLGSSALGRALFHGPAQASPSIVMGH